MWIDTFSMRHKIAIGGSCFAFSIKLYLFAFGDKGTVSPMSINRTRIAMFVDCDKNNSYCSSHWTQRKALTHFRIDTNSAKEFLIDFHSKHLAVHWYSFKWRVQISLEIDARVSVQMKIATNFIEKCLNFKVKMRIIVVYAMITYFVMSLT